MGNTTARSNADLLREAMGITNVTRTPNFDAFIERANQFVDGDRARKINERLKTDVDLIRNSQNLSDKGREVEIAKRYLEAHRELSGLRTEFHTGMDTHRTRLQRGMFGPLDISHEAIQSYRAARQLARQLETSKDALKELRWAQMIGDETYARAITHHATEQPAWDSEKYSRGWSKVVDAHGEHHPGIRDTLTEISELPDNSALEDLLFNPKTPREFEQKGDVLSYAERVVRTAEEPIKDPGYAFDSASAKTGVTTDDVD